MRSDEDLMADYGFGFDDVQCLDDARLLETAASLAGYERITDLQDLERLREQINEAYLRAVSNDSAEFIALAERAVMYHGRMERFLQQLVQSETNGWEPPVPSIHDRASEFLDRVAKGFCNPPMVVEGLARACEVLEPHEGRSASEYSQMCAISKYLTDMLTWSRLMHHDVVELGHRGAVLKMFEPILRHPLLSERLKSAWAMHPDLPPLVWLLQDEERRRADPPDVSAEWLFS